MRSCLLGPRAIAFLGLFSALMPPAWSQNAPPPKPTELTVSPAGAPDPSFRYSLLPSSARLNPGDAAPILLRLRYDVKDEDWNDVSEKLDRWRRLPLRDMPIPEARAFVEAQRRHLDLLAIAARRGDCDWGYPLPEQGEDVIAVTMPELQALRHWGRLQAVKARIEIAEGRFDDAAKSMETGVALGRKVGSGPFVVGGLVGASLAFVQLDCVEDWITTPGSPNLYWALTALPRPLVNLRGALEQERTIAENMIPELAAADVPRTPEGWTVHLEAMVARMRSVAARSFPEGSPGADSDEAKSSKAALGPDLAAYKRKHLAALREQLIDSGAFTREQVQAMGDDEAGARGVVLSYRSLWDRLFQVMYLPYAEAESRAAEYEKLVAAAKDGPFAVIVLLYPSIFNIRKAEMRLDRRVAMLRAVEAVRIHAAALGGELPDSLEAIQEVAAPVDPATGRPFAFRREGEAAVLASPSPMSGLADYRIVIRKTP